MLLDLFSGLSSLDNGGDGCVCTDVSEKQSDSCFKPMEAWAAYVEGGMMDLSKCPNGCVNGAVTGQLSSAKIRRLITRQPCIMRCPCLCPDFCEDRDNFEKTKCPSELTGETLVVCGAQYGTLLTDNATNSASTSLTSTPTLSDNYLPSSSKMSNTVEASEDDLVSSEPSVPSDMHFVPSQKMTPSTPLFMMKTETTTATQISSKQQEPSTFISTAFDNTPSRASKAGTEPLASFLTSQSPLERTESTLNKIRSSERSDKMESSTHSSSVLTTTYAGAYEVSRSSDPSVDHLTEAFFLSSSSVRVTGTQTAKPSDQPTIAFDTTGKAAINDESTTSLFFKKITTMSPTSAVLSGRTDVQNIETSRALRSTRPFTGITNTLYMSSTLGGEISEETNYQTSSVAHDITSTEKWTSTATRSSAHSSKKIATLPQIAEAGTPENHYQVSSSKPGQLSSMTTGYVTETFSTPRTSRSMLSTTMTHETDETKTTRNFMTTTDPAPMYYSQSASSWDPLKISSSTQPTEITATSKEFYDDMTTYTDNSVRAGSSKMELLRTSASTEKSSDKTSSSPLWSMSTFSQMVHQPTTTETKSRDSTASKRTTPYELTTARMEINKATSARAGVQTSSDAGSSFSSMRQTRLQTDATTSSETSSTGKKVVEEFKEFHVTFLSSVFLKLLTTFAENERWNKSFCLV